MATKNELIQIVSAQAVINQRYRDMQPLGPQGGDGYFSVVFRAHHIEQNIPVALKFLIDGGDAYRRACFKREGDLLSTTLKGHPEFVQLVEMPEILTLQAAVPGIPGSVITLNFPFLAFEWISGGDLSNGVALPSSREELLETLNVFEQVCRCVRRFHSLGCYHRDLKPGNFFRTNGSAVKLGDFGTAKPMLPTPQHLLSQYSFAPGDYRYTAPEALAGLDVTGDLLSTADKYSLGAIFFEFLTGQPLFLHLFHDLQQVFDFQRHMHSVPEKQREAVYHGFLKGTPSRIPNLRFINPEIPKCAYPLLTTILEMLAHFDYRQRDTSLDEVRNRLRQCHLVVKNELKYLNALSQRRARR